MEGQVLAQVIVGILVTYGIETLKRASWFPWLSATSSKVVKVSVSAVLAAASALAISISWDPAGVLTVSGLTAANMWAGAQAFLVSFLTQHIAYEKLVRSPDAKAVTAGGQ